ncbi:hypothetical protein [Duganella sp. BJB476]|uniref:hypothetical protein n=1 Tax=Duganella sp. BJB476 TaxID=1871176 RepID=UPI001E42DFF0|nr:hypothetical protein [Duganella sp. BJB476]
MFIIPSSKPKSITWPVFVDVPDDGGKLRKFEFTGTFNLLDDDAKDAIAAESRAAAPAEDGSEESVNAWKAVSVDRIMNFMTDWKGVVDEEKVPVQFSKDNLLSVARTSLGVSLLRGINTAINEINVGARTKN